MNYSSKPIKKITKKPKVPHYTCMSLYYAKSFYVEDPEDGGETDITEIERGESITLTPFDDFRRAELEAVIEDIFTHSRLNIAEREIVRFRLAEDRSYKQIGERLHLNQEIIRRLEARALKKLKRGIDDMSLTAAEALS